MKNILIIFIFFFFSCNKDKIAVDSMVLNANIYTVNSNFDIAEGFVVRDGKFIDVASDEVLQAKYIADTIINANGKTIMPGLIDAHCHFLNLGYIQQAVDLMGTTSFEEVVQRVVDFQKKKHLKYIRGRGWDENDWIVKEFPNKKVLDELFPDTPIALTRVDGHAILCNQAALDLGNVTINSTKEGGEVIVKNNELTGVLVDNAEHLVMNFWPKVTKDDTVNALMDAQDLCLSYGLTTVDDAGPDNYTDYWIDKLELIDSLQKTGDLKIRMYAMIPATEENLAHYLEKEIYKSEKLHIGSFKFYSDGALGSRGATLRKPYSDRENHYGTLVRNFDELKNTAKRIARSNYQMNTHAIGDSANRIVLQVYKDVLKDQEDRRWRVEHAQVVSPSDFKYFNDIIPSVQPMHATSDMYWAEDRVGSDRIKGAYAFKDLLNVNGKIALGTDFPVEQVNPFLTFYAAVARQDLNEYPENGFQIENALTREETLKGMTIWAAYANFEEDEKGSIEVGKMADYILLNQDIMQVDINKVPKTKVLQTYIAGEPQLN